MVEQFILRVYTMWPLSHKMVLFSNTFAAKETIVFHTSWAYYSVNTSQTEEVAIVSQLYKLCHNYIIYSALLLMLLVISFENKSG